MPSVPAGRARRDRYYELRRQGMSGNAAAYELGVDPSTGYRYERWFQAVERGERIVPGARWRRPAAGAP